MKIEWHLLCLRLFFSTLLSARYRNQSALRHPATFLFCNWIQSFTHDPSCAGIMLAPSFVAIASRKEISSRSELPLQTST